MKTKARPRRFVAIPILVTALAATVLAVYITHKVHEPERIRAELRLVEDAFGLLPNDAVECKLALTVVLDGSDGDLAVRTPEGWQTRQVSWPTRRPPAALCQMQSMKWKGEFLSETGLATWDNNQLQYRRQ